MDWIPVAAQLLVPEALVTTAAGSAAPGIGLTQRDAVIGEPTAVDVALATTNKVVFKEYSVGA